jgi:hypothetical protein
MLLLSVPRLRICHLGSSIRCSQNSFLGSARLSNGSSQTSSFSSTRLRLYTKDTGIHGAKVKYGGRSPKFIWPPCHVMRTAVLIG